MRAFLTFSIAFGILFLSMFGILIVRLCEDNRERFYGPLDGSIHVTDENFMPFFTYEAADTLNQNAEGITKISSVMTRPVHFCDMAYLGKDQYLRDTYAWERMYYPSGTHQTEYHEGFLLCAVTSMDILEEVYSGDLVMREGTTISENNNEACANKIVISASVAELNGVCLGDSIFLDPFSVFREEESATRAYLQSNTEYAPYEYIVGGIYEIRSDNTLSASLPHEIYENKVYIPISTLTDMAKDDYLLSYGESNFVGDSYEMPSVIPDHLYFHMENIEDSSVLEEKINKIGFSETILLSPYMSDAASSPSARLSEIVSLLLIGVMGLGFVVLVLAVLFNMRARHRELAVLVALGEKRSRVSFSFFAEIAILTAASLVCGGLLLLMAASFFAVPISDYLYAAEFSSKIRYESADLFLIGNGAQPAVAERMEDLSFLFVRYILPSFAISAGMALIILLLILGIVFLYTRKINALSGVGGKE